MLPGEIWKDATNSLHIILPDKPDQENEQVSDIDSRLLAWGFKMVPTATLYDWRSEFDSKKNWVIEIRPDKSNKLRKVKYIDCANLGAVSANGLRKKVGTVSLELLEKIHATETQLSQHIAESMRNQRFRPRNVTKFEYDIALSFAGEDRGVAAKIADRLRANGARVFYDDYEKTNLWGKELVQHLDDIYRNKAKFCVVLVSQSYRQKIWPSHELRSALARAVAQSEEYILPVRLDETELPGIQPTIGHLRVNEEADIHVVVRAALSKIGNKNIITYAELSSKWLENIVAINRLWGLDCLAFCVDNRFLKDGELECRIGISYGINPTSPRVGFLAPPEVKGANAFGIHCVDVLDGHKLCLTDKWIDAKQADNYDQPGDIVKRAYQLLADIPDDEYALLVKRMGTTGPLLKSSRYLLDEFEISTEVG